MKKLIRYSLLLIFIGIIALSVLSLFFFTPLQGSIQDLDHIIKYYISLHMLPFYIRAFIFIMTTIAIVAVYKNSLVLKKEIKYRKQIEKEARETGKSLEKSLALSKATLEATADGILVVDENRNISGHNQKFAKMWRIPPSCLAPGNDEAAVKHVLKQLKDPEGFVNSLHKLYNSEPTVEHFDELMFKDGRVFERYSKPQMRGDEVIGRVFSFRDVTQRKKMEEQLTYQATHDALTLLPNRVILIDRISQAIKIWKRSKKIGAVLFFDLDRFKLVNDSLGHDIGDILLQSVARRLELCVREHDTVSRLGGDEFVILLTGLGEERHAIPIVLKCLKALEEPFVIDKHTLSITSSVGVSFFPKNGQTPIELLKNADSAMYHAKAEGRNNYKIYAKKMGIQTKKQLELTNELHEAVKNNALTVYYQPVVDLKSASIVGAEALLRWNHPEWGFISPQEFIPIAEDTGLILKMGEWVLQTACLQNKLWQETGFPSLTMAINLSAQQFRQRNIPELITKVLQETNLDPQYLDLELTESVIMEDTQAFLKCMQELKKIGVHLVIDDFGTGYSSLSYLKRFPVDTLKIDIAFVAGLPGNSDDAAIVRAIIAMAQQLNLDVIAEGIETESQFSFLTENSCDMGQGFLFSKAIPAEEFSKLLKKNKFSSRLTTGRGDKNTTGAREQIHLIEN